MDRINQIRGTAEAEQFRHTGREASVRRFGHVEKRDTGSVGQIILEMGQPQTDRCRGGQRDGCCNMRGDRRR